MMGIGIGALLLDASIQLINNGISVTRSIYNTGQNIIYGKPKTDTERIEELTQIVNNQSEQIKQLIQEIDNLKSKRQHFQIRSNLS